MGFEHDALLYESREELLAVAGQHLRAGLAGGDGAVIAVSAENTGPLRDAVGDPRLVVLDRERLYRSRTAAAVAAFARLPAAHAAPGRRVHVVGEVDFGTTPESRREWQQYEAVLNTALAGVPVTGLCVFDTQRLPEPLLASARCTHPRLRTAEGAQPNPEYVEPASYLHGLPVPDEPLTYGPPLLAAAEVADFAGLRRTVRERLATLRGPGDLIGDFLLAVDEMTANAVRHGRPPVGLQLWAGPARVVCAIRDAGTGWDDPFAGFGPAHGADLSHGGMGLWLARQLCDSVTIHHDGDGTCVRLSTGWA